MPPKNNIQLGAGTLYFKKEDGELEPMGEVGEVQELEFAEDAEPCINRTTEASFEGTIELSPEAQIWFSQLCEAGLEGIKRMVGALKTFIIDCCPNRRVAHLIDHGKTRRVRKKNWRRAVNLVIKEAKQ